MVNLFRILIFLLIFYPLGLMVFHGNHKFYSTYKLIPNWYHDLEQKRLFQNRNEQGNNSFKKNFFFNKKLLSYLSQNGEALHQIILDNNTMVSPKSDSYVAYTKSGDLIELYNNQGEKQWSLDTYSFPAVSQFRGNIVLFSSDHSSIMMYDNNRNLLLPQNYLGSLITDYDFCDLNDTIVISTMESDVYAYNFEGKLNFKKNFSGSRFNYVKTVSCSPSGDYIAVVSGLYPEKIFLLNAQGEILWSRDTQQERRTRVSVEIDEINKNVLDLRNDKLFVLSLSTGEVEETLQLDFNEFGKIQKTLIYPIDGWIILAINGENKREVRLLNKTTNRLFLKKDFIDEYLNYVEIQQDKQNLYLTIHSNSSVYTYKLVL